MTLASARLKAFVRIPPLRGIYQRGGTCKGCDRQLGGGCKGKSSPKKLSRVSVQMAMATREKEVHRAITGSNPKGKEITQDEDSMEIEMPVATLTKRNQGDTSISKNKKRA